MTTLREAAQQALAFTMRDFATVRDFEAARAILHDTLKAALEQTVQEPVAWRFQSPLSEEGQWEYGKEPPVGSRWAIEPLYTHTPRREPLSDEELDRLWREPMSADWEHREYARAIEAAHGIKENT
jgi:hypothetical protein